jgi:hypothetical protein
MKIYICWTNCKIVVDKLENIIIEFIHQMDEWNNKRLYSWN